MSRLTLKPVLDTLLVLAIGSIAVVLVYDRVKPAAPPAPAAHAPAAPAPPAPPATVDPEDLAAVAAAYRKNMAAYYAWAGQRVGGFGALSRGEIEAALRQRERPFLYARARMLDRYYDDQGTLAGGVEKRKAFAAACAAAAKALEAP